MKHKRKLGLMLVLAGMFLILLRPLLSVTGFSIASDSILILKNIWFVLGGLGMILIGSVLMACVNFRDRQADFNDLEQIPSPIVARKLAEKIGSTLALEHPEMTELYRNGGNFSRYIDIARSYMGSEAKQYPNVCGKAVGYAMRELMSSPERADIRKKRKTERLDKMFDGFKSEKFKQHCVDARRKKEERGIFTDQKLLIEGRGQIPWTSEERELARELTKTPEYQISSGQFKGRPNYDLIALELNINFHDCKEVRYAKSVGNYIRDLKRRKY